jgi:hypothetical protein
MNSVAVKEVHPALHFTRGPHRFEIVPSNHKQYSGYIRYFDGHLSVTACERHVVVRMLLRKHANNRDAWIG